MWKDLLLRCFPQVERCMCCCSLRTGCKIIAAWELIRFISTISAVFVLAPTGDCGAPVYIYSVYILDAISICTVFSGATIFLFALVFLVFNSRKNIVTAGSCASLFANCLLISVICALTSLLIFLIHAFLNHCSIRPWAVSLDVAGNFLGVYNVIVLHSYSIYLKNSLAATETLPDDDVTKIIRLRSVSVNPQDENPAKVAQSHLYSSHRRLASLTDATSDLTSLDWSSLNPSRRSNYEWGSRNHSDRSIRDSGFGVRYKLDVPLDNKDKDKRERDKDKEKDKEKDKDKNDDNKDKGNKENEDNYNKPGSSKDSRH